MAQILQRTPRNAFGWRSRPAVACVKEAVVEIRKIARDDPTLASEGAVLLLTKVSARPGRAWSRWTAAPGSHPERSLPYDPRAFGRAGAVALSTRTGDGLCRSAATSYNLRVRYDDRRNAM
jgi:hypothetical protein